MVETTKNKGIECSNTERRLTENWFGLHEAGSVAKPRRNPVSTSYDPTIFLEISSTSKIQMCTRKYVQIHYIQNSM